LSPAASKEKPLIYWHPEPLRRVDALHWVGGKGGVSRSAGQAHQHHEFPPIHHQSHLMNSTLVPSMSGAPNICFGPDNWPSHFFWVSLFLTLGLIMSWHPVGSGLSASRSWLMPGWRARSLAQLLPRIHVSGMGQTPRKAARCQRRDLLRYHFPARFSTSALPADSLAVTSH